MIKKKQMVSIEQQLLATATNIDPDENELQKIRHLVSMGIDADALINLALQEGLAGFLYRNLRKADALDAVGLAQSTELQTLYYICVRFNLKLVHDLKQILHRLNPSKCRVVLMQGIALLARLYSDFGLRPLSDIDLWVLPGERSALVNALISLGYRNDRIYPNTFKRGSTIVDIHTHIFWAERIKARGHLIKGDQMDIFHNSRLIDFEGEKVRCLGTRDHVLYLSLHLLKHNVERLIWLADIKNLVKEWNCPEWEALIARAENLGIKGSVFYLSYLLRDLLDFKTPAEAQRILQKGKPNFLENMILKRRKTKKAISTWGQLFLLTSGQKFKKRLSFFIETMFPRPQILRQVFARTPDLKVWQLYWRRSLQILGLFKSL